MASDEAFIGEQWFRSTFAFFSTSADVSNISSTSQSCDSRSRGASTHRRWCHVYAEKTNGVSSRDVEVSIHDAKITRQLRFYLWELQYDPFTAVRLLNNMWLARLWLLFVFTAKSVSNVVSTCWWWRRQSTMRRIFVQYQHW